MNEEGNKNMKNDYRKITVAIMTDTEEPVRVYLDGKRHNCTIGTNTYYCSGDAVMRAYTFSVPCERAPYDPMPRRLSINVIALIMGLLALALSIIRMMGGAQ